MSSLVSRSRLGDCALIVVLFLFSHLGAVLVVSYIGDDHAVLDVDFSYLQELYRMYGKPELAYVFAIPRLLYDIHPLLLRVPQTLFPIIPILGFYWLLSEELGDRIAALVAAVALAVGFVWTSNLYIIVFPYVYCTTLLIFYAIICRSVIMRAEIGKSSFIYLVIIGILSISYEPLVIFFPFVLASLLLNHGIKPRDAVASKPIRSLIAIGAAIVAVQLIWFGLTPSWGTYEDVNNVSGNSLSQAIVDMPWHTRAFVRAYIEHSVEQMKEIPRIFIPAYALVIFTFMLAAVSEWKPENSRANGMIYGLLVILYAVIFVTMALFPFIVAGKATLTGYSDFENSFSARHYFIASMGVAIALAGVVIVARRVGRTAFVAALVVIGVFLSFDVSRNYVTYAHLASRSILTAQVVGAALKDPRIRDADTVVIQMFVPVPDIPEVALLGWSSWGPGYLWRGLGGAPDKLVVSDLSPAKARFIDRYVGKDFWYGFPHRAEEGGSPLCLQARLDYRPGRFEEFRNFWQYERDRAAFVRDAGKSVTFQDAPCVETLPSNDGGG